jgi:PAS domain S-box-containing protein
MGEGSVAITDGELLRAVLEGAPIRVAAIDRAGRFVLDPDPNPPSESDPGAPHGASFVDVYGDASGSLEAIQAAFAGRTTRLTRARGGATYAATFLPRRSPSGAIDAVFAVAAVLSGDVAMSHALSDVQLREKRIFDSPMTGLVYWEAAGAITNANDAFLRMVGYSRDDLATGRIRWNDLTPSEYRDAEGRALDELRTSGISAPYEKELVRKDGTRVWVLVGGSSSEASGGSGLAFLVDITERKRHERERREATQALQRVVDSAPVVLWAVDVRGTFTLSTGRGLQGLGLRAGQVVGMSAYDVYAGVPAIPAAIQRALAGEEFSAAVDVGDRTFETMHTPMRDDAGAVAGMMGVSIDITERRRHEAEQEKLRAQLLQVQKLESLGLLAGGIAHDFNNVLTVILGAASTALLTVPVENPARKDIENVISAAQRAAALTRQMLAYSGKAHIEIRPMDLSLHVREITSLLETTVPKKVQLRLELLDALPPIEADVAQIQQVIMNLVINGAEAIGDQQGTVLVTTGLQSVDALYAASLFAAEGLAPGQYVFLEVHDTGHGMDEATKNKIFDPFFTTKFSGRGLGLAAVLGIVRSHRGAIKVYSSPGRGTTFKVFFPCADRPAVHEPRATSTSYRGEGLVLVIDDDAGVRSTMRRILTFFGFSVIEAEDGQRGAQTFAAHAGDVVLVFLDMTMPRMNGEETFREIRSVRGDVPVILTSGYNEIEATRRVTSKGLAGFLEKPFTPQDLAAKLRKVLGT